MYQRAFIIPLIIFCSLCSIATHTQASTGEQQVIRVQRADQLLTIGKQLAFLKDTSGKLSIQEIIQPKFQEQFTPNHTEIFARPATSASYWFKITVENHTEADLWLSVGSTFCWKIDFYAPNALGEFEAPIQTGSLRPFENRVHKIINAFWLPLNKHHEETAKTFYIKLEQLSPFEVPIQIGSLQALYQEKGITDMLTAGFTGIVLIMLMYNLFLGFSTKDTIYFWYVAHLATAFFAVTCMNSYPFVDMLTGYKFPAFWQEKFFVWLAPNTVFAAIFLKKYLHLKYNAPIHNWAIDLLIAAIVSIAIINLTEWVPYIVLIYLFQGAALLLTLAFFLSTLHVYLFRKVKHAKFYLYGWSFYFVSISVSVAVMNGLISYNIFFRDAIYFGLSLEVWMFSVALGEKMGQLKKEKAAVQAENLRLVEEQVELLEIKVEERTQALQKKQKEVQLKNEEILGMNQSLERKVQERTMRLLHQNETLKAYAFKNAHKVRGPLARILGLLNLMNSEEKEVPYLNMLNESAGELDTIVKEMNDLLSEEEFFEAQKPLFIKEEEQPT